MLTRVLSAAAALAILIPLIIWGGLVAVQGVVAIALVVSMLEFRNMMLQDLSKAGAVLFDGLG